MNSNRKKLLIEIGNRNLSCYFHNGLFFYFVGCNHRIVNQTQNDNEDYLILNKLLKGSYLWLWYIVCCKKNYRCILLWRNHAVILNKICKYKINLVWSAVNFSSISIVSLCILLHLCSCDTNSFAELKIKIKYCILEW